MRVADIVDGYLQVAHSKTSKKLRIKLVSVTGEPNLLAKLISKLLEQRRDRKVLSPNLIITEDGRRVTQPMLRIRFDDARSKAASVARSQNDHVLEAQIQSFQFRDIRPKAATEIEDIGQASKLLGHTDKRITETVYRRIGEVVEPTK